MRILVIICIITLSVLFFVAAPAFEFSGENIVSKFCRDTSAEWLDVQSIAPQDDYAKAAKEQLHQQYLDCLAHPYSNGG